MYQITPADIATASAMGIYRAQQSRLKGNSQSTTICNQSAESLAHIDFIGALGEVCFARIMKEESQADEGSYKKPDHIDRWGTSWCIRSTDRVGGSLIVRDHDPIDAQGHFVGKYALIEIDLDSKSARIAGYTNGRMVRSLGKYEARGDSDVPCWWVAQYNLNDFEDYLEKKEQKARRMTAV